MSWYSRTRGGILCGGIAYSAIFSLFAVLAIGYTAFTAVLGGKDDLLTTVLTRIDAVVPGLIDMGDGGILTREELLLSGVARSGISTASVVASTVLVVSARSFMSALRRSVRTMFGEYDVRENAVGAVLREVIGFVVIVAGVVTSAAVTIVLSDVGTHLLELIGLGEVSTTVLTVVGVLVSVVVDGLIVALVVTSLAGMHPSRRDLIVGSLVAGVAFSGLRYVGGSFISAGAHRNALLASFATIVTLLLLVNVVARVLLLVCAWMADPPAWSAEVPTRYVSARELRRGAGRGRPWSPVVRGVRRGRLPRGVVVTE